MPREPGYCRHRTSNRAYVNLGGKVIYLGIYGSKESKERYNRLKAEWLVNRHAEKFQPSQNSGPFMSDLCLAYLEHAKAYYPASNEYNNLKLACGPVSELFATIPIKEFGVMQFRACRDWWMRDSKRSRQYINKQMQRLIRVIKWGVGQGMVPAGMHQAFMCVEPLKRGRTLVKESERVLPVEQAVVDATLPFLTPIVGDMVLLQQLTGCRPGEVVAISPGMVDRSSDVWQIVITSHKTAWRGKTRTLYLGPKAQRILAKYLLRAADAPCFSPIESERQRLDIREAKQRSIARKPRRAPGEAFTAGTYAKSIRYACRRAFPAPKDIKSDKVKLAQWHSEHAWSPNQLRHKRATELRKQFGIEASQVTLGHSQMNTTEIYAEQDSAKAIAIAREVG